MCYGFELYLLTTLSLPQLIAKKYNTDHGHIADPNASTLLHLLFVYYMPQTSARLWSTQIFLPYRVKNSKILTVDRGLQAI